MRMYMGGLAVLACQLLWTQAASAGVVLSGPSAFSSQAVTLNFDSLPLGTAVTNQYQNLGVVFSSVNGLGLPRVDTNELGGGRGLNGGPANPSVYTSIAQDAPLLVRFVDPSTGDPVGVTSAAGAFYIDAEPYIGQGFFFDTNGALLHRFVLDQDIDFWGYRVTGSEALIGSILFDSSGGYPEQPQYGANVSESYTIDSLIFEPVASTAIPEPSALVIWSLLCAVAAIAVRRSCA